MYKLLQIVDGNVVAEHALTQDNFRIGRNIGNELQPDDASVSGNHASIALAPSAYLWRLLLKIWVVPMELLSTEGRSGGSC